jgi:penicillin amidase
VAPYRIRRIREMLDEKEMLSIEDFKRMITDQHSHFAEMLTPLILRMSGKPEGLSPAESRALAALSIWDYEMNPKMVAPSIFEIFRLRFKNNILADELGPLYNELYYMTGEYYIYKLLMNGPDEWVDNINTPENETIDDIVKQSFKECIKLMEKEYGKNQENWEWGKIHTITFVHPLGSIKIIRLLYRFNSVKYGIGGSDHTVCPYYSLRPGFRAEHGASVRQIFNTADWDGSLSVIPGGISGVPRSQYYLSQVQTYLSGQFYKDHFSEDAVKKSARHILVLTPGK